MATSSVWVLPDAQSHGPEHWPRQWAGLHGYAWLEQHEWQRPLRGDWLIRLEESVLQTSEEVVLVAQGLSCALVAAWAAFSHHRDRVKAALLVAPIDLHQPHWREVLPTWCPAPSTRLPFKAWVVSGVGEDPSSSASSAATLAAQWGAQWVRCKKQGEPGAESALAQWPQGEWREGHELLNELMKD